MSSAYGGIKKGHHLTTTCTSRGEADRVINAQKPDLLIIGYLGEVSCLEVFREYSKQMPDLPIVLLSHTPEVNKFFREWVISNGGYDVVSWFPEKVSLLREVLQRLAHPNQSPQQMSKSSLEIQEVATPVPQPSPIASPPPSQNIQPPLERSLEVKEVAAPTPQPITAERIPQEIAAQSSESLQLPSERSVDVKEVVAPAPKASPSVSSQTLTYKQTLAALNQISESSLIYFGGLVIGNYWKKPMPT
ncbi:MAG: response regulator [Pseudanabaena sp. RU_4_16]|nr:response regulator [Pseudanabaena sp. RU_4_16]